MARARAEARASPPTPDRKSTRLNSSHGYISYAVFCLKKKKIIPKHTTVHNTISKTPRCITDPTPKRCEIIEHYNCVTDVTLSLTVLSTSNTVNAASVL